MQQLRSWLFAALVLSCSTSFVQSRGKKKKDKSLVGGKDSEPSNIIVKADLLNKKGVSFVQSGDFDRALKIFQDAVLIDPLSPGIWCNIGAAHKEMDQLEQALVAYRTGLSIDPSNKLLNENLEELAKLLPKARIITAESLPSAVENDDDSGGSPEQRADEINKKGVELIQRGQIKQAQEKFKEAAALDPSSPGIWCNLGNAQQASGMLEDALGSYRSGLFVEPTSKLLRDNIRALAKTFPEAADILKKSAVTTSLPPVQLPILPKWVQPGHTTLVECRTTKGSFVVAVFEGWAPLGSARFLELVRSGFFNSKVALYRVVEGFVAQFGISGDPAVTTSWKTKGKIQDDPLWIPKGKSNFQRGMVSFAGNGAHSRGTELFVALDDLPLGEAAHEVPFGIMIGEDSFRTMAAWYGGYGELSAFGGKAPSPQHMETKGLKYLKSKFPMLDFITNCEVTWQSESNPELERTPKKKPNSGASSVLKGKPKSAEGDSIKTTLHRRTKIEKETIEQDYLPKPSAIERRAEELSQKGVSSIKNGNKTEAIAFFLEALLLNPSAAGLWCNLGMAQIENREYAEALDSFQRGLLIDKSHALLLENKRDLQAILKNQSAIEVAVLSNGDWGSVSNAEEPSWMAVARARVVETSKAVDNESAPNYGSYVRPDVGSTNAIHSPKSVYKAPVIPRGAEKFFWWITPLHKQLAAMPRANSAHRRSTLRPGDIKIVDNFVSRSELGSIREMITRHRTQGVKMGSDPAIVHRTRTNEADNIVAYPPVWKQPLATQADRDLIVKIVARVGHYANERLTLNGTLPGPHRWDKDVGVHLGIFAVYEYQPEDSGEHSAVTPHFDSDYEGRCLSAGLHLDNWNPEIDGVGIGSSAGGSGPRQNIPVSGGVFQTMSCVESLDCSGAAGDKLARLIDDGVLTRHEEYLEVANEAAYLPGRLAMFLPETPHAVTPLLRGTRSILFMWFNCVPFTKPPQRYDQVQPAIERAAAKKKKMGASMNG